MKALAKIFYLFIFISIPLCQACPENCVCENEEEEEMCTECQQGFYNLDDNCNQQCDKCPGNQCNGQTGECTQDEDCIGFSTYGPKCDQSCEQSVAGCSQCHKNGDCFECSDKHNWGDNCNEQCPNCPEKTCDFYGKCDVDAEFCGDSSYYGDMCNTPCKNNNHDYCTKCKKADGVCTECSESHYGDDCNGDCSKCPNKNCKMSGECSTTDDFCGDHAYTGINCAQQCKDSILNCLECKMIGKECTVCEKSFYNIDCKGTCTNCPGETCYINGTCTDKEANCEDDTKKGDMCETPCTDGHSNCERCNRDETCIKCLNDQYKGDYCDTPCTKCPDGLCSKNGNCTDPNANCKDDATKGNDCETYCNNEHTHCEKCNRDGTCTKCTDDKFKNIDCEGTCPNCPGKTCYINGNCTDQRANCKDDATKGVKCETSCSDDHPNCEKCNRDGTCIKCLNDQYKGEYCEDPCTNCPGGLCSPDGNCTDPSANCEGETMKGDKCDTPCNNEYLNCEKCNRDGTCIKCSDDKYKGDNCETPCPNCPGETCYINGNCTDSNTNCKGDATKGVKCDTPCNENNEYCSTCKRDGTCLTCKDQLKYGSNCTDSCENCPGGICEFDDGTCINQEDCENYKFYEDKCQKPCTDISITCDTCYRNGICKNCTDELHYGDYCTDTCDKCPTSSCDMEGICRDTSSDCLNEETYGPKCETDCSEIGINCTKCHRNETCFVCINTNWYGTKCEKFCSHCPNNECKINGDCVDTSADCPDPKFYGDDCQTPCSNINSTCDTCTRDGICTTCTSEEFWGDKCEKHCDFCPGNKCHNNGTCVDQNANCEGETRKGEKCDTPCNNEHGHCERCNRDGTCLKCTDDKYKGEYCESNCTNCPDGLCSIDGNCTNQNDNCKDDATKGDDCETPCNNEHTHCEKCSRDGTCTKCTDDKFKDLDCKGTCPNCPGETCYINGTCIDQSDNCKNNVTKGEKCETNCSDGYPYCEKCNRDETCLKCTDDKYKGEYCESNCTNCPDGLCSVDGNCIDPDSNCKDDATKGVDCETPCNNEHEHCEKCNRTGTCIYCTDYKFKDLDCDGTCPNCPGETCYINGTCIDSDANCEDDTKKGEKCDIACNNEHEHCERCNRNGTCTKCTDDKFKDLDCKGTCPNCPGETCYINGTCIDQSDNCKNNVTKGEKCETNCSDGYPYCEKCNRDETCLKCTDDKYKGEYCESNCTNCPDGLCSVDGNCIDPDSNCKDDATKGVDCETPCNNEHEHCEKCNRTGTCIYCTDYKFKDLDCDGTCPNCPGETCYINGTCIDSDANCEDDTKKGEKCDIACNNEHEHCERCNRNGTCTKCTDDKFKDLDCKGTCPNCPGETCYINGTCIDQSDNCKDNVTKGEKCDIPCTNKNEYCSTCKRNGTCLTCKDQLKYGSNCTDSCENCPGDTCKFDDGTCINSGDCENYKFYQDKCQKPCTDISITCDTCYRTGICKNCTDELHFGYDCTDTCDKCPTPSCDMEGNCTDNSSDCIDAETYGPKCETDCSEIGINCTKCHRNETCFVCINTNWYGTKCEKFCSHCPNNECKINGDCVDTSADCPDPKFYGDDCQTPCSNINSTCDTCTRDGICTTCTSEEFWGDKCEKHCDFCPGNKCYNNGNCVDQDSNCIGNMTFGEKCDEPCTNLDENCLYCNKKLETCFECEDKKFYGPYCNESCANCPSDCDNNGICYDNSSLCINDTKTGPSCNYSCSDLYPNHYCYRCNREGICSECSNKRFHGDNCSLGCEGCSDTGCNIQGYCSEFKCKDSNFGLGCEHECTCGSNSDNQDCGKFGGQCLGCKFGYYGKTCQDRCYYKCQTELCCIFKNGTDNIKTKLEIKTNYKYINIEIKGISGKFEIDYNYGYPLTIFNTSTEFGKNCNNDTIKTISFNEPRQRDSYEMYFTNYFVNSSIFNGQTIKINNKIIEGVDITVAHEVKCHNNEDRNQISGIIGLGFFNSISNAYFSNKDLKISELNILSYFLEGDEVQLYFGNMFKEQINYVERLTSCDVILDSESDIQGKKMTCKLDGIKNAKYTEAFELGDAYITFSLGEKSSLILGNNSNYESYLEKIYFKKGQFEPVYENRSETVFKYYLYDSEKINKLPNFGFVFNKFYYTYSPDKFFKDESGNKKRFLIEINKNSSRTEFVIGKEFLEDIKFTINNEEAKIYFYAKNAEYSDKFTSEVNDNTFVLNLDAKESAAVSLSIIIFINLAAFSIFYCVKRRKMINSGDYNRLD